MDKLLERLKRVRAGTWLLWGQAALLLAVCLVHAIEEGRYADFYPINGTFQNYNPVRRLLAGQAPFVDFQDYLGLGHLFAGALATLLFGGSYRSSLMAFAFLTLAAVVMLCVVLGRSIVKKWPVVLCAANLMLFLILVQPAFFTNGLAWCWEMKEALTYAASAGNSARFIRGMVLPLCCLLYGAGGPLLQRLEGKWPGAGRYRGLISLGLAGALGGFAFLWSNDYGIVTWLCLGIMVFLVAWRRGGKLYKALLGGLLYGAASAITAVLLVLAVSRGRLDLWLEGTFGAGGYQGWYFNTGEKSHYLFDVDFTLPMMIQALVCLAYLIRLLADKATPQAVRRWGIPAFVNMTGFAAVNAYKLISCGNSFEVALTALFITLLFEGLGLAARLAAQVRNKALPMHMAVFVMCFAWVLSTAKEEVIGWAAAPYQGVYVSEMGGVVTSRGQDLEDARAFLQGESFFSTYASAQELVEGKFQPSGTDYIIHVLGDEKREGYVDAFLNSGFTYAATMWEETDPWITWETRADWYFYRLLYEGWQPVFANGYELYWQRGESSALPDTPSVQVVDVDAGTKKLVVQADPSVNGIADLYVDYTTEKAPGLRGALAFQPMVRAANTGTVYLYGQALNTGQVEYYDSNYLRPQSQEYIPVNVVDGYGEVTISAKPEGCCSFASFEARCEALYTAPFDYVKAEEAAGGRVRVKAHDKNRQCLQGAKGLEIQGKRYGIVGMEEEGEEAGASFWITLDGGGIPPEALQKGNMLHIVR